MRSMKIKLKNAAILRNTSEYSPDLHSLTRWAGKHRMLKRFSFIRDEVIEASDGEGAAITVIVSEVFKNKWKSYEIMMKEINDATVEPQTRMLTLAESRGVLHLLHEMVLEERKQPE